MKCLGVIGCYSSNFIFNNLRKNFVGWVFCFLIRKEGRDRGRGGRKDGIKGIERRYYYNEFYLDGFSFKFWVFFEFEEFF